MTKVQYFLFSIMLIWTTGCASVRRVEIRPGEGGVLAVEPAGSEKAREKADVIMKNTCQGKSYKIVKEAEVVVGQVTHTRTEDNDDEFDVTKNYISKTQSTTTETEDKTEWRITFKCL